MSTIAVHQIWLAGAARVPRELREPMQGWRDAVASRGDFRYRLWDATGIAAAVAELPFPRIRQLYPLLPERLWGIRADIGRLAVLYREGGVYADADTRLLRPDALLEHVACALRASNTTLVGVADWRGWTPWWVRWVRRPSNFLIACRPRAAFIARYLERIGQDHALLALDEKLGAERRAAFEWRLTMRWTGPDQLRRGIALEPEAVSLTPVGFVASAGQRCFPQAALAHDYAGRWYAKSPGWQRARDALLRAFLSTPVDGVLLGLLAAGAGLMAAT